MRATLLALALLVVATCAFVALRFDAHAVRVAALRSRLADVTARCAALNDAKHRLLDAERRSAGGRSGGVLVASGAALEGVRAWNGDPGARGVVEALERLRRDAAARGGKVEAGSLEAVVSGIDPAIDRCQRDLSAVDLSWGAEEARSGWRAVW